MSVFGPIAVRSENVCQLWIGMDQGVSANENAVAEYLSNYVGEDAPIQDDLPQLADQLEKKFQPEGLSILVDFHPIFRGEKCLTERRMNNFMRGTFLTDSGLRREFFVRSIKHQSAES